MTIAGKQRLQRLAGVLLPLLGAALNLLILMRRLIFTPGYIIYRDLFPGQLYYPMLWHSQGSFMALENYKFVTFTGLFLPLMRFGLDVYEKGVYISAMLIAYLAFYALAYHLLKRILDDKLSWPGRHFCCAVAAFIYTANPAAANIFFDFSLFVGYAFAPLILLLVLEMFNRPRAWSALAVGIAGLWWLSAIKAHWIVFGVILLMPPLVMWVIWHWRSHALPGILHNLKAIAVTVAFYLSFSAYWLIPFLYASGERFVGSYAPMTLEAVTFLSYARLWDTVRLLGSFQAWPYVTFESPSPLLSLPWMLSSLVIPALAVSGVVWQRKRWQVWTLAVFALGGILLAKGMAPPLEGIYKSLVFGKLTPDNFRWLFRVASKWNVFLSLGYSGLAAFALAELTSRMQNFRWRKPSADRKAARSLAVLVIVLLSIPLFFWPSFTGDYRNALVPVELPEALDSANQWLAGQEGDYKVNWMPVTNGRELTWNSRPSGAVYTSLTAIPSIHTNWNRHPMLFYSFIYDALANGQTSYLGKLLSPLNIRYVALHDDILTPHIHTGVEPVVVMIEGSEQAWDERFTEQQDIRLAWQQDQLSIYETAEAAPPVYVPQRQFLTTGDLSLLTSLSTLESFQPAENAIFFDASRNEGTFPLDVDGLLLKRDAVNHLMFAFLPAENLISPAQQTIHSDLQQNWSRFDIYQSDWQFALRDYGIVQWAFDYGQGMVAYASPNREADTVSDPVLEVPFQLPQSEQVHVWVRALQHLDAGKLHLSIDNRPLAVLDNTSPITGFTWIDAGVVDLSDGSHTIGIQNRGGFAAVNALALLSQSEQEKLEAQRQALAGSVPNIFLLETETDFDTREAEAARETARLSAGQAVVVKPNAPISSVLDILLEGEYRVAIRSALSDESISINVTLGPTEVTLTAPHASEDFTWLTSTPVHLTDGSLPVQIKSQGGDAVVDTFMLYTNSSALSPESLFQNTLPTAEVTYEQLDSTRYRVRVHTERPSILALAETYDPLWVASGAGFQASSLPLYGVINGFVLDQAGTHDLTVQFEPQQYARQGGLVTAVAVFAVIPFLFITYRRRSPS